MNSMHENKKDFFNERADRWLDMFYRDETTGTYTKFDQEFDRLFSLINLEQGDCVLDVGCGSGILVNYILPFIGQTGRLYELDYASKMIEVNKKLHQDQRIDFLNTDLFDHHLNRESCDVVICFSCFPHLGDKNQALAVISHILKTGGKLVISHFDSASDLNDHHRQYPEVMHDMLPSTEEMKGFMKNNGFVLHQFIDEAGFYCILAEKATET